MTKFVTQLCFYSHDFIEHNDEPVMDIWHTGYQQLRLTLNMTFSNI